ncbi:MAG TPA: hypothetical protein VHZ24_20825 [Pirellulales bacterium]|jgi:hypothetical protein|nr:hypothetical protein [Pirellulales bacterium]
MGTKSNDDVRFRLWLSSCSAWKPVSWADVPATAVAIAAAESGTFSSAEAAVYLEGFNSQMLQTDASRWLVAVPVRVRYEGDAVRGNFVHGSRFDHGAATAGR